MAPSPLRPVSVPTATGSATLADVTDRNEESPHGQPPDDHAMVHRLSEDTSGPLVEISGGSDRERAGLVGELLDRHPGLAVWIDSPGTATDQAMADLGLSPSRDLLRMDVDLPVGSTTTVETRAFEPGRDDRAWLETNNAAFAWHREQSGWSEEQLAARMAEDWFDPEGFRLYPADPGNGPDITAFCWVKVHEDRDPPVGEIYVIGVHPSAQGRGLGRALTLAGLGWMVERGLDRAELWVDADNAAAVGLYRKLGFRPRVVRRLYLPR